MPKVRGEIYIATCSVSNKQYVGQTQTHVLNHGVYRPYGTEKRWKSHVSEAINNTKKNQCVYLNNAIRKHGAKTFTVRTLIICDLEQLDEYEIHYINEYNTLSPNGYNLLEGGRKAKLTEAIRQKISQKTTEHFESEENRIIQSEIIKSTNEQRILDKYQNISIKSIDLSCIKENGIAKKFYLYITLDTGDIERVSWGNSIHTTYEQSLVEIKSLALQLLDGDDTKLHIIENRQEYAYLQKLAVFKDKDIKLIQISPFKQKYGYIVAVYVKCADDKSWRDKKRLCFGGKTVYVGDAFAQAQDFVEQLKQTNTVVEISDRFEELL